MSVQETYDNLKMPPVVSQAFIWFEHIIPVSIANEKIISHYETLLECLAEEEIKVTCSECRRDRVYWCAIEYNGKTYERAFEPNLSNLQTIEDSLQRLQSSTR